MKRRSFISTVAVASTIPLFKPVFVNALSKSDFIRPKALKRGDTIGIIAPATAVTDPDQIGKAIEALNYFGLNYKIEKNVLKGEGYKTRTTEKRLDDLHFMFEDKEISGVFCLRGGYGSAQLLDKIDYDLIKKNPKVFIGYSDITAMHLAINKFSGLITFHGPVLLSGFSNYTADYFSKALFNTNPIGKIVNPESKSGIRLVHPTRTIKPGKATGKLIGGNLSIICSLMGTPYEIDTKDKILFIEDVGEEPYRIDRMLTQLRLAGKLNTAAGIIFGECNECNSDGLNPSHIWDYSLGEVLDNIFKNLNIPVFYGLTFGHTSDQITLPVGVDAEIDADERTLNIIEAGVI
ncbi:MAG: LD-carboxypeptidase [Bacteroidetes bacterium]|nr:MAG: LD-carboxypeptidase [Bacteroidota bacterium]